MSAEMGIKNIFHEPGMMDAWQPGNRVKEFVQYINNNNDWSVKLHANHLVPQYPEKIINDLLYHRDAIRVITRRRNVHEQIVSHYIAVQRRKHNFLITDNFPEDTIELDIIKLIQCQQTITSCNNTLDLWGKTVPIDKEVYYEDLPLMDTKYRLTPVPKNYAEIQQWAADILLP